MKMIESTNLEFIDQRPTIEIATLLGVSRTTAAGMIVAIYARAPKMVPDLNIDNWPSKEIAEIAGWDGGPADLWEALLSAGVIYYDDDFALRLMDWGNFVDAAQFPTCH